MNPKKIVIVSVLFLGVVFFPDLSVRAAPPAVFGDVEQALKLAEAGKDKEALDLLAAAIQKNPAQPAPYFHRGMILLHTEELDRALSNFNKAIELNSKFAQAYVGRAMVYFFKHDLDAVLKELDQAIDLDASLGVAYYNRGVAKSYQEKFGSAFDDLTKAKTLGHPVEEELLGQVWGMAHPDDVIRKTEESIKADPKKGAAYYNRAVARYAKKDFSGTLDDLKKAKALGVTQVDDFIQAAERELDKQKTQ